jgi:hypothetical protein
VALFLLLTYRTLKILLEKPAEMKMERTQKGKETNIQPITIQLENQGVIMFEDTLYLLYHHHHFTAILCFSLSTSTKKKQLKRSSPRRRFEFSYSHNFLIVDDIQNITAK